MSALQLDAAIGRTDSTKVDPSNAGACLIIADRGSAPLSNTNAGRCALAADYADIRSHWPADDSYAIGIIYYGDRRDYRDQYSVTFLNEYGAQPGHSFTISIRARPNTLCSIVAVDSTGLSNVQGLDPKTTDAAGNVAWTWLVDRNATRGQWPITVTCGAKSGRTFWGIYF